MLLFTIQTWFHYKGAKVLVLANDDSHAVRLVREHLGNEGYRYIDTTVMQTSKLSPDAQAMLKIGVVEVEMMSHDEIASMELKPYFNCHPNIEDFK